MAILCPFLACILCELVQAVASQHEILRGGLNMHRFTLKSLQKPRFRLDFTYFSPFGHLLGPVYRRAAFAVSLPMELSCDLAAAGTAQSGRPMRCMSSMALGCR